MKATPQEISAYLDDMAAGLKAGPVGTPEFQQAVHENQERRKQPASDTVDAAAFALGEIPLHVVSVNTEPGEHPVEYTPRAPDYEEWFSALKPDAASLQAAFSAGDAHGADSQRSMICALLPDLVTEAEEDVRRLTALLRAELLRLQEEENPTRENGGRT